MKLLKCKICQEYGATVFLISPLHTRKYFRVAAVSSMNHG
jgi:hypothetical protein